MALEFFTSELGTSPGYTQERDFLFHVLKTAIHHWSTEADQDQAFCIHYETVLKQRSQQNIQMQSLISITLETKMKETHIQKRSIMRLFFILTNSFNQKKFMTKSMIYVGMVTAQLATCFSLFSYK